MVELELIDETFDKDRTEVYELSIQACLNGFSFAIKDTIRNTFIVLISKPFTNQVYNHDIWVDHVSETVSNYPFFSQKYKKVLFTYSHSAIAMVPEVFFEEKKAKELFELSHTLPEYCELHCKQHNNGSGFIQIFSLPYALTSSWLKIQPDTKFLNPISPLLCYSDISKNNSLLQVLIDDREIKLVLHENGSFISFNSFQYLNVTDAVYYILSFCKALKEEISFIKVNVAGESSINNDLIKTLQDYFTIVHSDSHYGSSHFSYQLLRYRNKFFSLFNSSMVCE